MDQTWGLLAGIALGSAIERGYAYFITLIERKQKREVKLSLRGYHLHHSCFGLLALAGFFLTRELMLLGMGLGLILSHAFFEKTFSFVEKDSLRRKTTRKKSEG